MKHIVMIILLTSVIVLGGCQMDKKDNVEGKNSTETVKPKDMEIEELPDVRAFQDEFTSGFLQSREETRPGYYPFLSGTGAFEMDFPAEGKLGEKSYNIREKNYEAIMIGVGSEESDITHIITVTYYAHLEEDVHKDSRLGQLQSSVEEELDFERVEEENEIYYIASYESDNEDFDFETFGQAAFIFNKNGTGGIEVIYSSDCEKNCDDLKEADMSKAFEWIKSIKFLKDAEAVDENEK